jgi:putative flippase GtrA
MLKDNKVIRYIFSGGVTSFSNFFVLYLLVQKLHIWYLTSAIISFCFGIIVGYCLHKFISFKNYSKNNIPLQFSSFLIYNTIMLGVNTLLMYIFVDIFGFWYLFSQVTITIFTAFVNYFIFNRIIFEHKMIN